MNTQITGHNMEVTPALREFTEKKLTRLLSHFTNITNVAVVFEVNKIRNIAEATIAVPGHTLHAQAESDDMYKSLDFLIDKLKAQLVKHKEKDIGHRD